VRLLILDTHAHTWAAASRALLWNAGTNCSWLLRLHQGTAHTAQRASHTRRHTHAIRSTHCCPPPTDAGASPEAVAESFHAFRTGGAAPTLKLDLAPRSASAAAAPSLEAIQKSMRLLLLVRAYQVRRRASLGRELQDFWARRTAAGAVSVVVYLSCPPLCSLTLPCALSLRR
jgi:hypothetical protein